MNASPSAAATGAHARGDERYTILIATYLEPEQVDRIRALDARLDVVYEPALLPAPRYPADHTGGPLVRSATDEAHWRARLASADILFDFPRTDPDELPALAPRVRWIQATSAGIGQYVKRHDYARRMPDTVFTTASGVHAGPLAEFCALGMLAFSRGLFTMLEAQHARRWDRFASTDLEGRTVVIYGYGHIGVAVARVSRALGMRTIGVKRTITEADRADETAHEIHAAGTLPALLPRAEFLVLAAPHTPETEHVIGAHELALLPRGAVLINVGRGALVNEPALIAALESGHLVGAALDVFEQEPLPATSPLWTLPNLLVSPHSASTSDRENARITSLFLENLRRFLGGRPLLNVLDVGRLY